VRPVNAPSLMGILVSTKGIIMSDSPSGESSAEDENESADMPLADPEAVAAADEDESAAEKSNLAPDDPNRTW
jgi:hypothetical protein